MGISRVTVVNFPGFPTTLKAGDVIRQVYAVNQDGSMTQCVNPDFCSTHANPFSAIQRRS